VESAVKGVRERPSTGHSHFETKIQDLLGLWKHELDGRWADMQEDWESVRERLHSAKEGFEKRASGVEEGLGSTRLG